MYIKRNLEKTISKYSKSPEIIAVVGPRQSGKTTMVNHLMKGLKNAASISFENQSILRLFEESPDDFIKIYVQGNKYLFIDEFQYSKNGGKILKYIFDTQNNNSNAKQRTKIIISGSSSIDLSVRAIKYLVGRILVFNLYPFNFQEFLLAKDANYLRIYKKYKKQIGKFRDIKLEISAPVHQKLLRYYEEYLLFGGYPRIVLENNYEAKKELLTNIYNTYFLREVKDILGLIDDYKLDNLIKGLALQIGNLIDFKELSRLSGYSYPSLKKYLNFLEKTYITKFVKPFYQNKRTEIVKNPKNYFFDTGLRNSIVDDFRKLDKRTDKGALMENGLTQEFIKKNYRFNFWRDKKKNEVDFILCLSDKKTIAIESKAYLTTHKIKSIDIFRKKYPDVGCYISYQNTDKKILNKKNIFPIYLY